VIPGATVTATHLDSGLTLERVSDAAGRFLLPGLPVGIYMLSVARDGFDTFTERGIVLQVSQKLDLPVTLHVGPSTNHVTVIGEIPLLATAESEGMRGWAAVVIACVAFSMLIARTSYSQYNTAEIRGTVRDAQGAVVPGAVVTAVHVASGFKVVRISDSVGRFFLPALPVGECVLSVALPGFDTFTRKGLVVQAGQRIDLPVTLQVGQVIDATAWPRVGNSGTRRSCENRLGRCGYRLGWKGFGGTPSTLFAICVGNLASRSSRSRR
jgi:hypothetical protein